jgi:hypothetical protein
MIGYCLKLNFLLSSYLCLHTLGKNCFCIFTYLEKIKKM